MKGFRASIWKRKREWKLKGVGDKHSSAKSHSHAHENKKIKNIKEMKINYDLVMFFFSPLIKLVLQGSN